MEENKIKVLILEDSEFDAVVLENILRKGGFKPTIHRVEQLDDFQSAIDSREWDIILADYNLRGFHAPDALELLQKTKQDIPFIIISGGIGEDTAVEAMKAGAHDYLMKGYLARLVPAVERELREARNRKTAREAEEALRRSERLSRLILENSKDAIILTDEESKIQLANPAVESVFGYPRDSIVGKNITLLLPDKLPDNTNLGDIGPITHIPNMAIDQVAHETVGKKSDNSYIVIEISFNRFEIGGKPFYAAFIRDITARKRAEKELKANQEQFQAAREIQQRLFPKEPPSIPGFDIAGTSVPALMSGGDYFDFLHMQDGYYGFIVADVTGHGVGPAMLTAETRAYIRLLARGSCSPAEILTKANKVLIEDLDYERYITALLLCINPETKEIVYVNAGHPPGMILDQSGELVSELKNSGSPLGINPDVPYKDSPAIQLQSGHGFFIFSDGIDETQSESGEYFGTKRISAWHKHAASLSANESLQGLLQAACFFRQSLSQADDMTAILVKAK